MRDHIGGWREHNLLLIGMWEKVGRKDQFCCSHCTNVYTNLSYTEMHTEKRWYQIEPI